MTDVRIATIVEGHGECEAVPILVRRIADTIKPGFTPTLLPPLRVPATKLRRGGEIERTVELAGRKLQGRGAIIVIIDCDWEHGCPATDAPPLLQRALSARNDTPIAVILAKKEFESWFLAAAESLRGKRGLAPDIEAPHDPESIRGAKEWLSRRMGSGRAYSETEDQPAFAAMFDLNAARRADSFDKCFRDIERILRQLHQQQ
jgi:hypothetical protein